MADDQDPKRRVQGRSPPFPFIPLERAVIRAREFAEYSKGHPVRMSAALSGAWKYNPKSSGGIQTVAALKGFGLIVDSGSNDDRKLQVSDLTKRLLRNPPAPIREAMLREAALKPRLIGEYWRLWSAHRPPDEECIWTLVDERGFTDDAAAKFLSVYDATLSFAGLAQSDTLSGSEEDIEPDMTGDPDEEEPMAQEPLASPETRSGGLSWMRTARAAAEAAEAAAQARHSEWTERLRDRNGIEISVEFDREPSAQTYEYLRDYINFKLGTHVPGAASMPAPSPKESDTFRPNNTYVRPSVILTQAQHAALNNRGVSDDQIRAMDEHQMRDALKEAGIP